MKVRIGGKLYNSLVNGEGIRYVVFLSGCDKDCKGCHNQELRDFNSGSDIDIDDLVKDIAKNTFLTDGVTISGGDPLCQYEATLELCKKLKDMGLNIWLYTGEKYDKIIDEGRSELLKYIDVLVDGPFIESLKCDTRYKGSSNQRILSLKNGEIINERYDN